MEGCSTKMGSSWSAESAAFADLHGQQWAEIWLESSLKSSVHQYANERRCRTSHSFACLKSVLTSVTLVEAWMNPAQVQYMWLGIQHAWTKSTRAPLVISGLVIPSSESAYRRWIVHGFPRELTVQVLPLLAASNSVKTSLFRAAKTLRDSTPTYPIL